MTAPTPNTHSLYSLSKIKAGTADTKPAKAAPAPNDTIKAGNAQHTSVPVLVNSDSQALSRSQALDVTEVVAKGTLATGLAIIF
jgi:hypothetical protein